MNSKIEKKDYVSIGGQAIIEGVMMRSPNAFTIAVRKPDGKIVLNERKWDSISSKYPILKKPFLRGTVVLVESLINGVQALTFSANASQDESKDEKPMSKAEIAGTLTISFGAAMLLFVAFPHAITALIGKYSGTEMGLRSFLFHAVDGVIKMAVFVGYIYVISLMKDIQRIFEFHGAEHKVIYTFESGEALTVENARKHSTLHPRCGTTFLLVLLVISILFFTVIFGAFPIVSDETPWFVRHFSAIIIKMFFVVPIAGLSYEYIKYTATKIDSKVCRALMSPGLALQKLTTREPDDSQLEVAIASLKQCLWREKHKDAIVKGSVESQEMKGSYTFSISSIDEIEAVDISSKEFLH